MFAGMFIDGLPQTGKLLDRKPDAAGKGFGLSFKSPPTPLDLSNNRQQPGLAFAASVPG